MLYGNFISKNEYYSGGWTNGGEAVSRRAIENDAAGFEYCLCANDEVIGWISTDKPQEFEEYIKKYGLHKL